MQIVGYVIDPAIAFVAYHVNERCTNAPQAWYPPRVSLRLCAPDKRVRTAAKRRNKAGRRRRFCKVGVSQSFVSASIIPLRRRGVFMRRIKTGRVFTWLILKIAFLRNLWYNICINRTARCCPFFIVPHHAGFFYLWG